MSAAALAQQETPGQTAVREAAFADFVPLTDEILRNPDPGDWLMMRGNYEMWGYSTLDQINRDNIGSLTLAWARVMGQEGANQGAPLVYDGIMFLPNPWDQIQAIDAATGSLLWNWQRERLGVSVDDGPLRSTWGQRKRSVFLYGDRIYTVTANNEVVAIDARTGQEVWATPRGGDGYATNTSGPIVVEGIVVAGGNCQVAGFGCYVTGHDADTGEELWRNEVIPRPGEPGDETWGGMPFESRWCTGVWGQITYDPETNLVHYGSTGICPAPDVQRGVAGMGATMAGTNTRFAVRPETGEIVWSHQVLPQDNWDQECTFDMMIIPTVVNPNPNAEAMLATNPNVAGTERRTLSGMPCKNPVFWSFDSVTGEFIYARSTWAEAQNIYDSIDDVTGLVHINPEIIVDEAGETVFFCTFFAGGRDWPSGAYYPPGNIMIQPTMDRCTNMTSRTDREPAPQFSYNVNLVTVRNPALPQGDDYPAGRITAVNVETGETAWQYTQRTGNYSPVLATAGGLLFNNSGDRYFFALDIDTGEKIWQTRLGSGGSGYTVTYEVDGVQYLAVVAGSGAGGAGVGNEGFDTVTGGNMIYVFSLPQPLNP
ncbi:MAG: PQQ-binding-like beta-propeller repeat protein [Bauldia sp.]|nr:PQQ-binding-like beta-propeller repeat protein [Bauldia sp.]MCW5719493.1 PQQ-binding-like beta-propeller repeat protein [Bauldia sp.]